VNTIEKEFCNRNEEKILESAGSYFGINKESLKSLGGGFANYIYEYEKNGQEYILRFSLSSYRSFEMVEGELDWIKYLYDFGVPVAKPITLKESNDLVGYFEIEEEKFSVVSFEKLKGKMGVQVEWSADLIEKWGQVMGKIHALSKRYIPKDSSSKRLEWHEDELIKKEDEYIPNYETLVIEKLKQLKDILNELPKDEESYGMIHGDFTPINFMVDNNNIFVYDFDDCEYNWYAMDIAKALYYAMWRNPEKRAVKDNKGYADYFLMNFIEGYLRENPLEKFWLDKIPLFLKFYEIYMYKLAHKQFDIYNIRPEVIEFFKKYKYNIENDIPYIESAFFPWG